MKSRLGKQVTTNLRKLDMLNTYELLLIDCDGFVFYLRVTAHDEVSAHESMIQTAELMYIKKPRPIMLRIRLLHPEKIP